MRLLHIARLVLAAAAAVAVAGAPVCRADRAAKAPEEIRAFCIDFNWGPGGENGFAAPDASSLPKPVAEYKSAAIDSFSGNDRNIAVLARLYNGVSLQAME